MSPAGWRGYRPALKQARALLRSRRFDAIHCGKCLPEGLVALLARRGRDVPIWTFAHGEELTLARTSRELRFLTARVLARSTGLVANSEHTRRLLLDDWRVDPARVHVLTPGVDTRRFVPADPAPDVRARLGWTGRTVILTVGALQKRKGQDMMIRALPAIRASCPDVLYAIAGEGWEREYLSDLARGCGVKDLVQFRGVAGADDLVEIYQQCDLFALPNRQIGWDLEGFGIVLIEAQACGKPVIAGASGGTSETLLPGETGEIVRCDTPEPLAAATASLLVDAARRRAYGERAREWAVTRFDWNVLARRAAGILLSGGDGL
jgi:phosphatidylinositol alpha-1,6-mannosyltransferase